MSQQAENLVDVLPLYRELGFFASFAGVNNDELAAQLREQYQRPPLNAELRTNYPGWDIALLGMDTDRTYWYDSETAGADLHSYADFVEAVARISRGAFRVSDVEELWDAPLGPVHLRFRHGDRLHQVDMGEMVTDFLEVAPIKYVEQLVRTTTPYEVVHLATGDQSDFVVVLASAERDRLQAARPALFDFEGAYD